MGLVAGVPGRLLQRPQDLHVRDVEVTLADRFLTLPCVRPRLGLGQPVELRAIVHAARDFWREVPGSLRPAGC